MDGEESECNCAIELLLNKPFRCFTMYGKKHLVSKGRPTPSLPGLFQIRKTGGKIVKLKFYASKYSDIPWLCGCKKVSRLYCWPCLLFSADRNAWNNEGVVDINNLGNVLRKRHQQTIEHIAASVSLKQYMGSLKIENKFDSSLSKESVELEQHNSKVKSNRYVVEKLIDMTCCLTMQEQFRGSEISLDKGIYGELLKVFAKNDELLEMHLKTCAIFSGENSLSQSDLIDACSEHLLQNIEREISETKFISVIVNENIDFAQKSNLSMVIRYVDAAGGVQERFTGFLDVGDDRTSDRVTECLSEQLDRYRCKHKLIALTFDSVTVDGGLAAKVKTICHPALFTTCHAHKSNLVLQNSVKSIKQCKVFLINLCSFSVFFTKRLHGFVDEVSVRFPSLAPARWLNDNRLVEMVYDRKEQLKELCDFISENDSTFDAELHYCAMGFRENLNDLEFNFFLEFFHLVQPKAEALFKILQKKVCSITFCNGEIQKYKYFLVCLRGDFERFWARVKDFERTAFQKGRKAEDSKEFYRRLYFELLDNLLAHIKERFSDFSKLEFFALLKFSKFQEYSLKFPEAHFKSLLKSSYGRYFNEVGLNLELRYIYSSPLFKQESVSKLNDFLTANDMHDILPEFSTLAKIFLTIPARSVATGNVSSLKRIKSIARNMPSKDLLSGLGVLAVEKELFETLVKKDSFYDSVLNNLAEKMDGRLDLTYRDSPAATTSKSVPYHRTISPSKTDPLAIQHDIPKTVIKEEVDADDFDDTYSSQSGDGEQMEYVNCLSDQGELEDPLSEKQHGREGQFTNTAHSQSFPSVLEVADSLAQDIENILNDDLFKFGAVNPIKPRVRPTPVPGMKQEPTLTELKSKCALVELKLRMHYLKTLIQNEEEIGSLKKEACKLQITKEQLEINNMRESHLQKMENLKLEQEFWKLQLKNKIK